MNTVKVARFGSRRLKLTYTQLGGRVNPWWLRVESARVNTEVTMLYLLCAMVANRPLFVVLWLRNAKQLGDEPKTGRQGNVESAQKVNRIHTQFVDDEISLSHLNGNCGVELMWLCFA